MGYRYFIFPPSKGCDSFVAALMAGHSDSCVTPSETMARRMWSLNLYLGQRRLHCSLHPIDVAPLILRTIQM
jgi:hypothetical protein